MEKEKDQCIKYRASYKEVRDAFLPYGGSETVYHSNSVWPRYIVALQRTKDSIEYTKDSKPCDLRFACFAVNRFLVKFIYDVIGKKPCQTGDGLKIGQTTDHVRECYRSLLPVYYCGQFYEKKKWLWDMFGVEYSPEDIIQMQFDDGGHVLRLFCQGNEIFDPKEADEWCQKIYGLKFDFLLPRALACYKEVEAVFASCKAENVVYKSCGSCLVALEKLPHTTHNESRSKITDPKFAKFRGSTFLVRRVYDRTKDQLVDQARSVHDPSFVYRTGQIVRSNFDENLESICTEGIHYFTTLLAAFHYGLYWSPVGILSDFIHCKTDPLIRFSDTGSVRSFYFQGKWESKETACEIAKKIYGIDLEFFE